ncbi:DUF1540 domain-containing protein [Desertibacillus haloalkaliphilus]|uniref:DUF1540 domain-containing protein n=1 Tax=Desertibacillus haloalkaliphilus TaxID=1328930 RepID=UPI001C277B14|nr:DUF1540 domain-containing protein [Desertibacillus haloalkaliphilus]MBU8905701.1 DUF1540 domain-containing protein [Desertibacillus haloalkaliphilus]
MTTPIVKCNVSNCTFWGEGNNCQADSILVEVDRHANNDYNVEASGELLGDADHKDEAGNVAATCCHTFKPKNDK